MSSPSSSSHGLVLKSPRSRSPVLQYPPSPPLSHASHDSDDSLRALELSDGPAVFPGRTRSGRSYSLSGFDFQHDLLPLSASLSDPDGPVDVAGEKNITLINGTTKNTFNRDLLSINTYFIRDRTMRRAAGKA